MTIQEKVTEVINDYVSSNGTLTEMDCEQLYSLVTAVYPINKGSFIPSDYCYNRNNEGIDFEKHVHLFARADKGNYRVLGENYSYSGPVYYRRRGETEDSICGTWNNGVYEVSVSIAENIELRLNDLFSWVKTVLKTIPVNVFISGNAVVVYFQELLICGVNVEEAVYKIYNATSNWKDCTSYHCDIDEDGTWYYYLETIDECIGEVQRLVMFELNENNKKRTISIPTSMTFIQHRKWVESIIAKLALENPLITYRLDVVKDTPVYLRGKKVIDVYYRKSAVRINVKLDTKQYQIYKEELPKNIAYQKETADSGSTGGIFAFFVDDENIEFVLRKLLMS